MPQYGLAVVTNGVLSSTIYTLNITGHHNSNTHVKYSSTGSGPWTDFSGTAVRSGSGTPNSPSGGDTLTLTGSIGTYSLSGTATYDPPGQAGNNGYYRSGSITGDDADWQAVTDGK